MRPTRTKTSSRERHSFYVLAFLLHLHIFQTARHSVVGNVLRSDFKKRKWGERGLRRRRRRRRRMDNFFKKRWVRGAGGQDVGFTLCRIGEKNKTEYCAKRRVRHSLSLALALAIGGTYPEIMWRMMMMMRRRRRMWWWLLRVDRDYRPQHPAERCSILGVMLELSDHEKGRS